MNDYFIWNGVNSTTKGIYVLEQPPIIIPEERVTFTDVPGRSGSLTAPRSGIPMICIAV